MAAQGTGKGWTGTRGQPAALPADPGARTEVARIEGGQPEELEVETDDPEMTEIRAYAAEVVRAAGGVPRRSGYLPRLDAGRPALAINMVPLLSDWWWQITSRVRLRPMRTLAVAVAGSGALAGALFLSFPGQGSLELEVARPSPIVVAAAPLPPPPMTSPFDLAAPPTAPAAGPAPSGDKPAVPPRDLPGAQAAEKRRPSSERRGAAFPLLAERTKRTGAARSPGRRTGASDTMTQRRGGRRIAAATAGRGKGKEIWNGAHAKQEKDTPALDKRAIIEGMLGIQPLVKQCYREHKVRGVANVGVEVAPGGKVKRVTVTGPLARTRTAGCVKAAVKTAQFRGSGAASFHYPLVLQ